MFFRSALASLPSKNESQPASIYGDLNEDYTGRQRTNISLRQWFEELGVLVSKLSEQFKINLTLMQSSSAELCILTTNASTLLTQLEVTLSICSGYHSCNPEFCQVDTILFIS
jgi:hypothetical protein